MNLGFYLPNYSFNFSFFVDNEGCAMPIAQFDIKDGSGNVEKVDPRMLMHIHEAFGQ